MFKENQENNPRKIDVIDLPDTAKMAAYAYQCETGLNMHKSQTGLLLTSPLLELVY